MNKSCVQAGFIATTPKKMVFDDARCDDLAGYMCEVVVIFQLDAISNANKLKKRDLYLLAMQPRALVKSAVLLMQGIYYYFVKVFD